MIYIFGCLFILNIIPKELDSLRRKAIKSSILKPLSNIKVEPIISPSKPYISDSFIGTVLHPIFSYSVKELKGFAISKNRQHIAIIIDKECNESHLITEEKSVFFTDNNEAFSLTTKFADDGIVIIFNITKIDLLSAFNNFDFSLSSLNGQCSSNFGKHFGARCYAQSKLNWDDASNLPAEIVYNNSFVPDLVIDNLKFYGGVTTDMQASVIVKRRGASIFAECDMAIDSLMGAGFHIKALNSSTFIPSGEFSIGKPIEIFLGEGKVHPLGIEIKINASIYASVKAKDVLFDIPHDIDIMRTLSIHLNKHVVISSKHVQTSDFEKVIKVNKINTEAYNDDELSNSTQINFNGTFMISTGIKIGLYVNDLTNFVAVAGPNAEFDLSLDTDTEKCTFPGLYGAFTPNVSTICLFSGSLGFAGIKFIDIKKPLIYEIYKKEIFNGCFFDGLSSTELDAKLLEGLERKRSIIQAINLKVKNASLLINEIFAIEFFYGNNNSKSDLKYMNINLTDSIMSKYNDYLVVPEGKNISYLGYLNIFGGQIYSEKYPYPFEKYDIDAKYISLSIIRNKSQPIIMGNQFYIRNYYEFRNFRSKFMPSKSFAQSIGLILHNTIDGYFCDPTKYYIRDEIDHDFVDKTFKWTKIYIKSIKSSDMSPIFVHIYKHIMNNDKELSEALLSQIYYPLEVNKPMIPEFENSFIQIKQEQKPKVDKELFRVTAMNNNKSKIVNPVIVTYGDILNSPFTINFENIEVTFDAIQNEGDVEYIFRLKDSYINQIKNTPNLNLKVIVSKTFYSTDQNSNPIIFTGSKYQSQSVTMKLDELYGTFLFYFKDPGYNMTINKNIYAFIQLKNAQPLLKSSRNVDEKEELYTIKIEVGISVIQKGSNTYILSIPFRRKTRVGGSVTCTLYSIFQSYEQNEGKDDPFCPDFPEFKLIPNDNFYVGCIRTYIDKDDFSTNTWDHYPNNVKVISSNIPGNPPEEDMPFSRLHEIKVSNSDSLEQEKEITIVAKQQYFTFPLKSRVMIIEDDTIVKLKKYAPKDIIQIWCPRCGAIYMNSSKSNKKLFSDSGNFMMGLGEDINGGFILESICKDDDNDQQYCTFEYNIKDEGYVLLEFNPQKHQFVNEALDDSESTYPGVEEIYDAQDETIEKSITRFNINCRRQIIPPRNDTFWLTKTWKGVIKKIATNLEKTIIDIELVQIKRQNYIELEMIGHGFQAINQELSDQQLIPFNPRFITETDDRFKELLSQLGISIQKEKEQALNDGDISIDSEGILKVKIDLFDEKLFKENVEKGRIEMIDLPPENYNLRSTIREEKEEKGKKKKKNIIDQEASPNVLGNFDIKVAYVGGSPLELPNRITIMKKLIDFLIPPSIFYHSAIWIGPYDEKDDVLGVICVYGGYYSFGNDPTFISSDGARAYVMSLGKFKKSFNAYNAKKLLPQINLTLNEFLNNVKLNGNWRADDYDWIKHNCQHFTAFCLKILQTKRLKVDQNDWKYLPTKIMNIIEANEINKSSCSN